MRHHVGGVEIFVPLNSLAPLQQSPAPLRDKIISALRGAVETGELAPGVRLVERDLCERLGVSRTSLREALRELVAEGVLTPGERRGLVVTEITLAEAQAAYSLRSVIQALIAEQFVERASEAARAELSKITKTLVAEYRRGDIVRILEAKRAFYAQLCAGAENMLAFNLIERLCLRVGSVRTRATGRTERNAMSIKEIERISAAIEQRDQAAAKQAMLDHMDSVATWALSSGHSLGRPAPEAKLEPAL
jgi:DNA-binding GntR family transcriptional regulator